MGSKYRIRNYQPGDLIHFTCRGFNKRRIFHDRRDHEEFLLTFKNLLDEFPPPVGPRFHAYGQMPNHQHLLVSCGTEPEVTRRTMQSLCLRYAMSYNARNARRGPVFQKRFRGHVVRGGDYIANTFAYIHLNPDASLRVKNSSHAFYAGLTEDPHIDPSVAWRVFGGRDGYMKFFDDTERIRAARSAAKWRFEQ